MLAKNTDMQKLKTPVSSQNKIGTYARYVQTILFLLCNCSKLHKTDTKIPGRKRTQKELTLANGKKGKKEKCPNSLTRPRRSITPPRLSSMCAFIYRYVDVGIRIRNKDLFSIYFFRTNSFNLDQGMTRAIAARYRLL